MSREKANIDCWATPLTPSSELRRWYHEQPRRSVEFARRYRRELLARRPEITDVLVGASDSVITLVSAVRDLTTGHVPVLLAFLREQAAQN